MIYIDIVYVDNPKDREYIRVYGSEGVESGGSGELLVAN